MYTNRKRASDHHGLHPTTLIARLRTRPACRLTPGHPPTGDSASEDSSSRLVKVFCRRKNQASAQNLELNLRISSATEMKIAVEGCMHGELDNVYATLLHIQEVEKIKVDLLICCGDFQAIRNERDLESLNVPAKYRHMNTFHKYYSGEKAAPIPTIFIGGNHEASNYMWELYYGGWAAPQIYFLGMAGVVKFGNVRIGGISGIYNRHDYYSGHYEKLPYNEKDIRSIYHVREFDFYKLMQLEEPIDIFMSHDWPLGVTSCGDLQNLLRRKPFFEQEIREGTLGNRAAAELLDKLKPSHWFSAHLHCKFSALVQHGENGSVTKFLALDKCLPGRNFLQIVDIPSEMGPCELQYDEEWLAITRKFNPAFPRTRYRAKFGDAKLDIQDCRQFVRNKLQLRGGKPFEFVRSAPCYNPSQPVSKRFPFGVGHCRNPQTEALVQLLELQYVLDDSSIMKEPSPFPSRGSLDFRSEDIPIDDVEEDGDEVDEET